MQEEEEGVKFIYNPPKFSIGCDGATTNNPHRDLDLLLEGDANETRTEITNPQGSVSDDGDGLEDVISLDDFAKQDAQVDPATVPPPGESKPLDALLADYISLDLLEDAKVKARHDAEAVAPSALPELLTEVPWRNSLKPMRSPLVRLHHEIVEFCRYVKPSPEEDGLRLAAIARVSDVITSIWPNATAAVFGSFATGLHLPSSDVDLVVLDSKCGNIPTGLRALANLLARRGLAKNMQVIAKAKVPIVKFEEKESGYNFDISFDVANGPEAAQNVNDLMQALPAMRPIVMVLKVFLQQRELNEVYSGGIGSYALLVMVAAFLQTHPSRQKSASSGSSKKNKKGSSTHIEPNLGLLLLDFLRLYGRSLRHTHVGVSCRKGGSFFSKQQKGFYQEGRPHMLAVEDPNDPTNDLGKGSFMVSKVRMAFDFAYGQLLAPSKPGDSLLKRVIRLDPVLFARGRPTDIDYQPPALIQPAISKKNKERKSKEQSDSKAGGNGSKEVGKQQQPQPKQNKKSRQQQKGSQTPASKKAKNKQHDGKDNRKVEARKTEQGFWSKRPSKGFTEGRSNDRKRNDKNKNRGDGHKGKRGKGRR